MDHGYYSKPRKEQVRVQVIIGATAFAFNLCMLLAAVLTGVYFIVIISVILTLSVIAPFYDTPSLKQSGRLIYYAPLFLAEREKKGVTVVHGGTLFDYVFVIDKKLNGRQRTNLILRDYLQGLLKLIETYETGNSASVKVRGTSYILNERTAGKIGFRVVKTDVVQKVILIYNYVNLMISMSIAKAKLTFPNLRNIKTYEAQLTELTERKAYIARLCEGLEKKP